MCTIAYITSDNLADAKKKKRNKIYEKMRNVENAFGKTEKYNKREKR